MKFKIIFYCLLIIIISCKSQNNNISSKRISEALNYTIDGKISKKMRGNFIIEKLFCNRINDSIIYRDLIGIDTFLTEKNVKYMTKQYNRLQNKSISKYLNSKYQNKLSNNKTITDSVIYIEMSPPMFNIEKNKYVIFIIPKFTQLSDPKWDAFYLVYYKDKNDGWELKGLIKSSLGE